MDSKRAYIKSLKLGTKEVFNTIRRDIEIGETAADDAKVLKAQKAGIQSAHSMILHVYKYSQSEEVNENKWIVSSMRELLELCEIPSKRLLQIIQTPFNDDARDGYDADRFYGNKAAAMVDYNDIDKIITEFKEIVDSADKDGTDY